MEPEAALPLVSVIIPVYNGANYLKEAVESVFAQTYAKIELILVDDGSTDDTWGLIGAYGSRVCAIHKENGGVASALNAGIRRAQGELVAWLSHDDLFLPGKIARQVQFLAEHPEFGMCYTDFEIINAGGDRLKVYRAPWYPAPELPRSFLSDMHINGSTVMIRKTCLESAGGFNESLPHTQDLDMWLRIAEHSELGHLPEVLVKFRSHADQGSLNFELQIHDEQSLFRDLFERLGPAGFFPELAQINDPTERMARGRSLFADALRAHRHWYRFGLEQYQLSNRLHPAFSTRWKMVQARATIWLLGDERESLTMGKRARIYLGMRQPAKARQYSAALFLRHPLRIDALAIWLASWIPQAALQRLKQLKRRFRP